MLKHNGNNTYNADMQPEEMTHNERPYNANSKCNLEDVIQDASKHNQAGDARETAILWP